MSLFKLNYCQKCARPISKSAFTLIEIIITIAIIGLLGTLAIPKYFQQQENANFQEAVLTLDTMGRARTRWMLEHPTEQLTDCAVLDVTSRTSSFNTPVCNNGDISLTRQGGAYTITLNLGGCFSCSGTCPGSSSRLLPVTSYCASGLCSPTCTLGEACNNGVCVPTST